MVKDKKRSHAAFEGTRSSITEVDPESVVIVGLDTPAVSRDHPLYDDKLKLSLDPVKVAEVKRMGIRLPVVVRKNGEAAEVVDGRTRVRWARQANMELEAEGATKRIKIKLILTKGSDKEMAALKVTLNECREETPPSAKARAAQDLINFGYSNEEVAAIFCIGVPMLKRRLDVLDLDPEVQDKVDAKELTIIEASRLARTTPREKQKEAADKLTTAPKGPRRPSKVMVRERAESFKSGTLARVLLLWTVGEATMEDLEKALKKEGLLT